MSGRPVTIRQSMLRNFAVLILLTSGTILLATWVAGSAAVEDLSKSLIERTATRTETELDRFFGTVQSNVMIGTDWVRGGILDPTDHEAMNTLFVPILRQYPQLSSMMVATSDGVEYLLLRDPLKPTAWTNRIVQAGTWGRRVFNRRWDTATGEVEEDFSELEYDPRNRIWYREALKAQAGKEVFWTEPVIFFITKDPGITAATHWEVDGTTYVVAFDLLLLDISRFTTDLPVSSRGTAFVLVEDTGSDELAVVGLPRDERYDTPAAIREALLFTPLETAVADTAATLPPAAGHSHPAMSAAVSAWAKVGKPETAFRFQAAGEPWWGGFHSYPLGKNTFRIGVVVPEQDFLGDVIRQRNITLAVSLVALAVALAMALAMARTYGRPLESLADSSRRIRGLDLDEHAAVESTLAEITQLAEAQQQMLSTLQSFAKYVPMEVVRELLRRGEVAQIGGTSESLTILFTDISGFTTIAEALGPEALTDHMADYFHEALTVLERHEATVDKLIGDAIVAFWGAPRPDAAHADHALAAVLEIQRQLAACNARWRQQGLPELHTRFGLATGRVIVGNVGARSRLSYTVLGDTVNLAARLEGINKFYGTDVLVSEEVRQTVTTPLDWRLVDLVAVKGKRQGKRIYEPLGPVGQTDRRRLDFARRYELAWAVYQNRQFGEALAMIETLQQDWPDDVSLTRLRQICAEYQQHPPPEDWDGVARMATK